MTLLQPSLQNDFIAVIPRLPLPAKAPGGSQHSKETQAENETRCSFGLQETLGMGPAALAFCLSLTPVRAIKWHMYL